MFYPNFSPRQCQFGKTSSCSLRSPLQANLKIPSKTRGTFSPFQCKQKPFWCKSKNYRVCTLEPSCFTRVFRFAHSISLTRAQQKPKPAPATLGKGFIIDPFRPGAITNPSFNETYLSFELFFCFCYFHCLFYIFALLLSLSGRITCSIVVVQFDLLGIVVLWRFCFYVVACLRAFCICFRVSVVVVVMFVFGWLKLFVLIVSVVRLFVCLLGS